MIHVTPELLFLHKLRRPFRALALTIGAIAIAGVAIAAYATQHHLAAEHASGVHLDTFASIIANGSNIRTVWPGWIAALFFAVSVLLLRRTTPEPPIGLTPAENLTVSQLRGGFRREYRAIRVALLFVVAIALVDLVRFVIVAVSAFRGDSLGIRTVAATGVEAAGLLVAALVFATWAYTFRREIDQLGAI